MSDKCFGRMFIKRGTAIKLGDKEVEFNPTFKMFLHTKIANPHYKPELQVLFQCSLFSHATI